MLELEWRRTERVENRGRDVYELNQVRNLAWPPVSRPADEQGSANGLIVSAMLLESSMVSQAVAVVSDIDDQRILVQPPLKKIFQACRSLSRTRPMFRSMKATDV
jgi:hypothetical protein